MWNYRIKFDIISFMKQRNVLLVIQPAYPERIQGIARFAKSHGWHLTIVDRLARFPRGWRGDGALVTLRGNAETNRFVKGLVRDGVPVVDLTYNHPEIRIPRVSGDHEAFGRLARQHFESLNFRHFAWFSSEWSHVHELRYQGYAVGTDPIKSGTVPISEGSVPIAEGSVPVKSEGTVPVKLMGSVPVKWVWSEIAPQSKIDDWPFFVKLIGEKLGTVPRPLAVLTYDDADAARVLSAALEAGYRVPDDIAIMGIGNDRVICENQAVPLSSVDHDLDLNGYEGATLLDKLMSSQSSHQAIGQSNSPTILLPPRGIVVRKSTDTLAADDPTLALALREISKRLPTSFGVNEVAAAINVSRTRLDQLFAEKFSRSVGREIARQRIEKAKKFLAETDCPMKEIAAQCGFCNAGYFTNAFRTATGMTPKAWRRPK